MTRDTDGNKHTEGEAQQENGAGATTEAGVAEMGGAQVVDKVSSGPVTAEAETPSPTHSENATVEENAAVGTDVETSAEETKEPKNEVPTYPQEYVDQLNASHDRDKQFYEQRLREVEAELKDRKAKLEDTFRLHQHFKDAIKSIYLQLGDATPAKLYAVVVEMAQLKQQADEAKEIKKELEGAKSQLKAVEKMYLDLSEKNKGLNDSHCELVAQHQKLQEDYNAEVLAKNDCQQQLKSWETVGSRMIAAFAPFCLKERDWFQELLSELQEEVYKDPPSDAAILLFASLAELAVMERNSAAPCFEWKKQLADIGLVVANYMHQKKSAEGDVLKMLRNFSQALQEMPVLKKLKIVFKVPHLGSDFNTDEVKHKNNGASIAKVFNWCIIEDGHVYCKAIVE